MEFEYRYTDNCIFKGSCPRQDRIGCSVECSIQPEFYYLLNSSNIPNQYKKTITLYPASNDIEVFNTLADIKNDIDNFVKDGRFLYLWGDKTGNGKAQPLYSKLLTPKGYINMGDVKVGDEVFGEDGKSHKVLGVFPQGKKPVYELTFSDGSKCRCSDEHLWTVSTNNRKTWKTLTLSEIVNSSLCHNTSASGKQGKRWKYHIPITMPINFTGERVLPIDSWLLGVLIGDGGFTHTSITFTNSETDILDKTNLKLQEYGCVLSKKSGCDYSIVQRDNIGNVLDINNKVENTIRSIIKQLGLINHKSDAKFIPKDYLYSDVNSRINILQGLFDADGTIDQYGHYNYSTSSKQLAEDIVFLVQSLGGTCSCKEHETFYTYNGERKQGLNNFELYIKLPSNVIPYTSNKHTKKAKSHIRGVNIYRTLRSIDFIGEEECQCILIDSPSHLYLTDNMIVTHNTSWVCKIMKTYLASICIGNEFRDRAWFEYIPSFLLLAKDFESTERKLHIEALAKRDLVILDDIGAVYNTQYDITVLSDIINTRYSNGLATMITSNISPSNMNKSLTRLTDRMCSDIVLEIQGKGRRKSVSKYVRIGDSE